MCYKSSLQYKMQFPKLLYTSFTGYGTVHIPEPNKRFYGKYTVELVTGTVTGALNNLHNADDITN